MSMKTRIAIVLLFSLPLGCCVLGIWAFPRTRAWHATHIQGLVAKQKANPKDLSPLQEMIRIANGKNHFAGAYAVWALRELPEHREIVVPELLRQLRSVDRTRARESAIGLTYVPAVTSNEIDEIVRELKRPAPGPDVKWFCVDALAAAGKPALTTLPLLRSMLGSNSSILEEKLQIAIEKLEAIQAEQGDESASQSERTE